MRKRDRKESTGGLDPRKGKGRGKLPTLGEEMYKLRQKAQGQIICAEKRDQLT